MAHASEIRTILARLSSVCNTSVSIVRHYYVRSPLTEVNLTEAFLYMGDVGDHRTRCKNFCQDRCLRDIKVGGAEGARWPLGGWWDNSATT